jgi:hypothetical protein
MTSEKQEIEWAKPLSKPPKWLKCDCDKTPIGKVISECYLCGFKDCPYNHELHYHHDGCPACMKADAQIAKVLDSFIRWRMGDKNRHWDEDWTALNLNGFDMEEVCRRSLAVGEKRGRESRDAEMKKK